MNYDNNAKVHFHSDIAVIGMSGRFPGAHNIQEFWENLKSGIESISFFNDEQLMKSGIKPEVYNSTNYVRARGILDDIEYFDASFFGYTNRETEMMDPQIRIFHECAWEAMEDSGYNPHNFNELIGVYTGASSNLFWEFLSNLDETEGSERFEASHLNDKDYLNSHISYKFNLKGPSYSLYTACSTSLVAIHSACKDLISNECELALVGGVSASIPQEMGYTYQEGMVNSPDGHCRAFDAKAQGTVSGNGVGCIILKRADKAIEDGDSIYAVIKGTAINNDGGKKVGYTAPSIEGQVNVIRAAQKAARVSSESIGYVEAHGTGTTIGDPIEVEALKLAFDTNCKNYCGIGSVKTNIGHLDSAAGIASFIKTVLALKNKLIPPSLNFEAPNHEIDLINSPFYVNNKLKEWKNEKYPLRAGINSLGIGGTNAHIILEEAPKLERSFKSRDYKMVILSAKTESALNKMSNNLLTHLEMNSHLNLADIAYTLQVGRKKLKHRKMFICGDTDEAIELLRSKESRHIYTNFSKADNARLVFMFPGQGSQYINMGYELYHKEPIFRAEFDKCCRILRDMNGPDIKAAVFQSKYIELESKGLERTSIAQPLIFSFEYALAKYIMKMGIKPYAMIGYSFGEYVAACIAEVFPLKDALKLVVCRGNLMEEVPKGAMLSVPLTEADLKPLLNKNVSLAIVNGASCIVSGSVEDIELFEKEMKNKKYMCMRVPVAHGSHCSLTYSILDKYKDILNDINFKAPKVKYISNVTGTWITAEEATSLDYWIKHLTETVRFADGIKVLSQISNAIFLEVGAGQDLSLLAKRYVDETNGEKIISLIKKKRSNISDVHYIYNKIGLLWLKGIDIDWNEFYIGEQRERIHLPTYPFEKEKYWALMDNFHGNTSDDKISMIMQDSLNKKNPIENWYYQRAWKYSIINKQIELKNNIKNKWLIFIDNLDIGNGIAKRLQDFHQDTIIVEHGEEFKKVDNNHYYINALDYQGYENLFKELYKEKRIPDNLIHMWSIYENNTKESNWDYIDKAQELGVFSLVNIIKALNNENINENININVISNNTQDITGEELLSPEKSTLIGICKVIPQENSNISCKFIDTELNEFTNRNKLGLVSELLKEFTNESSDTMIAYRSNRRLIEAFDEVLLNSNIIDLSILKESGVYLITGGLGNIGFAIARYIACKVKATLVLIGRTCIPNESEWDNWLLSHDENDKISGKINKIKELRNLGSVVITYSVDVENINKMKNVITNVYQSFDKINGVVYAAGITEGQSINMLSQLTRTQFDEQFKAKIYGIIALEDALRNIKTDFCAIFSSLSTILGGIGFGAYAAANIYMDSFVHKHNKDYNQKSWICIDWDAWQGKNNEKSQQRTTLDDYVMSYDEGIEAFMRIISNNLEGQIINSTGNLKNRIDQWIKLKTICNTKEYKNSETTYLKSGNNLLSIYKEPRNKIEKDLVNIWQNYFGIDNIGINDSFFDLGGDSLKGITLLAKIHKELNVKLRIDQVFEHPTIEGLAEYIKRIDGSLFYSIDKISQQEYYPLSSAQKRMYLINQFDEKSTSYNIADVLILKGIVDVIKLEDVFKKLISRHEALRTSFNMIDGIPVQRVEEKLEFNIIQKPNNGKKLEEHINEFIRPFDLSKTPLLRVELIEISQEEFALLIDTHHIISDGVTIGILVEEFSSLYNGKVLPDLRIQYKDYSVWQEKMKESQEIKKQREIWLDKFKYEIPILNLPIDYMRPVIKSFEGDNINFSLDLETTKRLKSFSKQNDTTLYMVLLAAYNILLYRYTGQQEIIVGTPVAGRPHVDLENILGLFVNTLAMKNHLDGDKTFKEVLHEVKTNALEAFVNQDYQFEDFLDDLNIKRDMGRNPLFDTLFVFQNTDNKKIKLDKLEAEIYTYDNKISKFDVSLKAYEYQQILNFSFEYSTNLFKRESIEQFRNNFISILREVAINQDIKLSDINMLSQKEREKILYEFNDTEIVYSRFKVIHELFEEQVRKTANSIAVEYNNQYLTYEELNKRSNQVARVLRKKGVKADTVVAILANRSFEMIIAMLGILKAGGAYMPIDPKFPIKRIQYMLQDSKVDIILTEKVLDNNEVYNSIIINLFDEEILNEITDNLNNINSFDNLAYVMYTSGTTSKSKGVLIEHRNVVRLVDNTNYIKIKEDDRILQTGAIGFDATTFEIWTALLNGLRLYLIDEDILLDANSMKDTIEECKITILWLTSSLLNQLVKENESIFEGLRYLLVGGDILNAKVINNILNKYKQLSVVNVYGPTENTTFSTSFLIDKEYKNNIPIGKPISNSTVYILDGFCNIQPIGIPGELCVGGDGLARGYLNNNDLTEKKFIENPYLKGQRLYKTGDLARWMPDGNIEFLGRIDNQVKIRGFRMELGEIENALLNNKNIKEAVVIVEEDDIGNKYLCAYIIKTDEITISNVRNDLSNLLPNYMIPSYIISLDQIPLTLSGKVDKKSLPKPNESIDTGIMYVEPKDILQKKLVNIWKDVLVINQDIGIKDNFFEIGGHSLKATLVVAQIHKKLNIKIPISQLFKNPSIEELSEYIRNLDESKYKSIPKAKEKEYYEVSSAEKRMYIINQYDPSCLNYNMPMGMVLNGYVDKDKIEQVFNELIKRHETLRTSFHMIGGKPVQKINKVINFKVEYMVIDKEKLESEVYNFIQPFDLSKAPLLRVKLIKLDESEYAMVVDIHHIISDGITQEIIMDEFAKLYNNEELPQLIMQYKDYSEWQQGIMKSEEIKIQENYWLNKFKESIEPLNLPLDYERPELQNFLGDSIEFSVETDTMVKLKQIAKDNNSTLFMVLVASLNVLLYKYTGQHEIVIGTPIAGRTHIDLANIVGIFVNTLAIRTNLKGNMTFNEFLIEVRNNVMEAYENQDYQFEELVEKLDIRKDMSRNPIFDIVFTLQNINQNKKMLNDLVISEYKYKEKITKFDITLNSYEGVEELYFELEYRTSLFKSETIKRLSKHFINVLEQISQCSCIQIDRINILTMEETKEIDNVIEYVEILKQDELYYAEFNFDNF